MAGHAINLERRGRRWFVRLTIPPDIRHAFGGRSYFKVTTLKDDKLAAAGVAGPIVAGWWERIRTARKTGRDTLEAEVEARTRLYRAAQARGDDDDAREGVIEWALKREATGQTLDDVLAVAQSDWDRDTGFALEAISKPAAALVDRIIGLSTPWLAHEASWFSALSGSVGTKTADEYRGAIKRFDEAHDGAVTLETITGSLVQAWVRKLETEGKARATIQRIVAGLRSYWIYMEDEGLADRNTKPFAELKLAGKGRGNRQAASRGDEADREPFTPQQVVALARGAALRGDGPLASLVALAAFTGARLEELCQLTTDSVDVGAWTLRITKAKTRAGRRVVPIHPAIKPLVQALVAASHDGYLISSTAKGKYGKRGDPLGKRFTRLKRDMGHGKTLVFHSIRKTVATLFKHAECPWQIAADILGHENPTMTYGVAMTMNFGFFRTFRAD